jgi:hypothetical protein
VEWIPSCRRLPYPVIRTSALAANLCSFQVLVSRRAFRSRVEISFSIYVAPKYYSSKGTNILARCGIFALHSRMRGWPVIMPMLPVHILGLSAYYHDSAACLLRDGDIVAAAQEERFTRVKGDASFPCTPGNQ